MLAVFSLVASLLDITLLRQNDLLGKWLTRFFVWHPNIAGPCAKMDSVAIYDYIQGSTMQITTISQKSRADLILNISIAHKVKAFVFTILKCSCVSNHSVMFKEIVTFNILFRLI